MKPINTIAPHLILICFVVCNPAYAYLIETSAGVTLTGLGIVSDSDSSTNPVNTISISGTGPQTGTDGIDIFTGEAFARAEITTGTFGGMSYDLGVIAQTTGTNLTARSGARAQFIDSLTVNLPAGMASATIGVTYNIEGIVDGDTAWIDGFIANFSFGPLTNPSIAAFNQNDLIVLPDTSIIPLTFSDTLTVSDNDTLFLSTGIDARTVATLLLDFNNTSSVFFDIPEGVSLTSETGIEFTGVIPIPAAIWLFGSGVLGLIGFARRNRVH